MAKYKLHVVTTLILTLMAGISGCGLIALPEGWESETYTHQPTQVFTDPAELLAVAELAIPEGAENIRMVEQTKTGPEYPPYHFAYTVTWDGTIDTTDAFLVAEGIEWAKSGRRSQDSLGRTVRDMVIDSIPEGSRGASWAFFPEDAYGNVEILLEGPELTTVHVSVAVFPF